MRILALLIKQLISDRLREVECEYKASVSGKI